MGIEMDYQYGINNLLDNCLGLKSGSNVLIIHAENTFFKKEVVEKLTTEILKRGCFLDFFAPGNIASPEEIPTDFFNKAQKADYTIFFDPLGGMLRFIQLPGAGSFCMTFIADNECLKSMFCTVNHADMVGMMQHIQKDLDTASQWRITCPAGTFLESATVAPIASGVSGDGFSLKQFPMGSHRPMLTSKMSGTLAIKWLVSTGVHKIEPFGLELENHVIAHIDNGKIVKLEGADKDVNQVLQRYQVAGENCKNKDEVMLINSWHAGIHPYSYHHEKAADDYEKWITLAHHNPRMVHFHSCGDFNPGEIAIPVIDSDIFLDGEKIYHAGSIDPKYTKNLRNFVSTDNLQSITNVEPLTTIGV